MYDIQMMLHDFKSGVTILTDGSRHYNKSFYNNCFKKCFLITEILQFKVIENFEINFINLTYLNRPSNSISRYLIIKQHVTSCV